MLENGIKILLQTIDHKMSPFHIMKADLEYYNTKLVHRQANKQDSITRYMEYENKQLLIHNHKRIGDIKSFLASYVNKNFFCIFLLICCEIKVHTQCINPQLYLVLDLTLKVVRAA